MTLDFSLSSSGISCSHQISDAFKCLSIYTPASPGRTLRLFRNTVGGVEAVLKLLAVLVRGVFGEELAVCGALKGLEARLALDGLGGGVLCAISSRAYEQLLRGRRARLGVVRISAATWPPWDRHRPCGRASAVLYGLLVWPCFSLLWNGVLGSVTHVVSRRTLVGDCENERK